MSPRRDAKERYPSTPTPRRLPLPVRSDYELDPLACTRPILALVGEAEERGEALELIRLGGATAPWRIAQTDLRRLCPALDVEPTELEQLQAQVR
jgi:hypothetical protein